MEITYDDFGDSFLLRAVPGAEGNEHIQHGPGCAAGVTPAQPHGLHASGPRPAGKAGAGPCAERRLCLRRFARTPTVQTAQQPPAWNVARAVPSRGPDALRAVGQATSVAIPTQGEEVWLAGSHVGPIHISSGLVTQHLLGEKLGTRFVHKS